MHINIKVKMSRNISRVSSFSNYSASRNSIGK